MTPRVEAWIRQAQNNLEAARFMAGQGFHTQARYLAGQAAEKALKALVLAAGITPPYSHSLEKLVELLQQQGLDLPALADLFDANDSSTALGTAEAVVRIAMTQLQA